MWYSSWLQQKLMVPRQHLPRSLPHLYTECTPLHSWVLDAQALLRQVFVLESTMSSRCSHAGQIGVGLLQTQDSFM